MSIFLIGLKFDTAITIYVLAYDSCVYEYGGIAGNYQTKNLGILSLPVVIHA